MKFIIKKAASLLITLVFVSLLVFLSFEFIPGDPASSLLGTQATPEKVEALREEMGLNRPTLVRYLDWSSGFIRGDMGTSYSYHIPVKEMVGGKVPITLALTLLSFCFTVMIAIPLGIYMAKHAGGRLDSFLGVLNQIMMAVPAFFAGILLTFFFGLVLHWFTPGGFVSYEVNLGKFFSYLILPAIAIAIPKSAMTAKLLRGSILEQSELDYARTAYSRGNSTNDVLWKHLLKNAMIPVITFLGMVLADMIAGSIIIEQVFGIPGLGRILLTSIANRDYPVVQAIIMILAIAVNLINAIVDIIYHQIDPRIKYQ